MTSVIKIVDRTTVDVVAAAWLAQLDGGNLSEEDMAAFREWINRTPEHRATLLRMAQTWIGLEDVIETHIEAITQADVSEKKESTFGLASALMRLYPGKAIAGATMMMLAIACSIVLTLSHPFGGPAPATDKVVYAAAIGEQKEMRLEDGTQLRLNTNSSVEVDFSENERSVRLLDGEAWFDVAHNAKRPFVVYAGDGAVRAVGTSFAVRKKDTLIDVTVTGGRVVLANIKRESEKALAPLLLATLEAGHQAVFNDHVESIEKLKPAEIERKLAWREGFLRFNGQALSEVVEEISRYTTVKIQIDNETLRNLQIGGYFQTGDIDTMLEVLEQSFGVAHQWHGDGEVRLFAVQQ